MTHKLLIGELVLSLDVQLYESRPDACTVAVGDFKGTAFVLEFHRCSEDLFEPPPDSTLEAALRAGKPRKPAGKEKADKLAAREIRLLALPETAHSGMLIGGGSTKRPKQKPRGGRASRGFGPYVTRTILKLHSPEGDGLNEGSLQVKVCYGPSSWRAAFGIVATGRHFFLNYVLSLLRLSMCVWGTRLAGCPGNRIDSVSVVRNRNGDGCVELQDEPNQNVQNTQGRFFVRG